MVTASTSDSEDEEVDPPVEPTEPTDPEVPPEPEPAPDPSEWQTYADTMRLEMQLITGTTDMTGVCQTPAARACEAMWAGHVLGHGDYLTRYPGDPNRGNWWVTPSSIVGLRYLQES